MTQVQTQKQVAWPVDRREELADLRAMLVVLSGLDRGSHFLEHVAECIKTADRLIRSDINNGRESFIGYVTGDACRPVQE